MPSKVPKAQRRTVFGRDPEAYDRARLRYPPQIYQILADRCGLRPGASVLEIGPGTGIATRELLRRGAGPLTLVEPDRRLARYLRRSVLPHDRSVRLLSVTFEEAPLARGAFDLVVAASSFHWIPPRVALRKVARVLRPGGWWAMWNNHHGDPYRASPFQRAIQPLYRELRGGRRSYGRTRQPRVEFAREVRRRLEAVRSVGAFERVARDNLHWRATLPTARVVGLWGTFSDVLTLPAGQRRRFLSQLGRVVDERFRGRAAVRILTPMYTARRR